MRRTPAFRRAVTLAALLLLVGVSSAPAPGAEVQAPADEFVIGTGGGSGTIASVRIYYAGLSIPLPLGQTASTYEGQRARALGAVVNAGAASTFTGAPVEGTTPVVVDSQGESHQAERSLAGPVGGTISLGATNTPSARSEVHLLGFDSPGLLRIEGGHSSSSVRVEDGQRRVAQASVTIASVTVAGGLVELEDLRWDASHASTASPEVEAAAAFTVGGVRIAGAPLPLPAADALPGVIDTVNAVLGQLGLTIGLPAVQQLADGSIGIGGLRVRFGNSVLGTELFGPLLGTLRPLLQPAVDAVVEATPELGIATLLLDLGLGLADGTGGVELSVGGANAVTDGTSFDNPFAVPPDAPGTASTAAGAPELTPDLPVVGGRPGSPGGIPNPAPAPSPRPTPAAAVAGPERCGLAASPRRQGGCRSANERAALAVGVASILAMSAYEIAIRRRRAVPSVKEVHA